MKKYLYGLFCFLFFVLAISARAQETPPTTPESADESLVADESPIADEQSDESVAEEPADDTTTTTEFIDGADGIAVDAIDATETETEATVDLSESSETYEAVDVIDESIETTAEQTASVTIPAIYISEVNWAGSELSQADEWIELFNASGATVDLSGWVLTGCATSGDAIALGDGTMLAAGNTLLVSNYDLGNEKTTLAVQPDLVTASVSLSNSALEILLVMPDGTVVDAEGDGGAPPAGSTSPKASMQRDLSTLAWVTAEASINLLSADQFGNPGSTLSLPKGEQEGVTDDSSDGIDESFDASDTFDHLILSEFVSNPVDGAEEWIEIYNPTDAAVNLEGWTVRDATLRSSPFTDAAIDAGAYAIIMSPSGQLNNGGDTIELVDPDGTVIDALVYGSEEVAAPGKGYALARINDTWTATTALTPGSTNIYSDVLAPVEEPSTEIDQTDVIDQMSDEHTDETSVSDQTDASPSTTSETEDSLESVQDDDTQTASSPTSYEAGVIIINELVSDPAEGDVEWIELFNTTDQAIDLSGWTVTDATGKATELEGQINAQSFAVLESPKGKLNNDADSAYLYDPAGNLINQMHYGTEDIDNPSKGDSLAWTGASWIITDQITKGSVNATIYEEETITQSDDTTTAPSTSTPTSTSTESATHNSTQQQTVSHDQQTSPGNVAHVSTAPATTESHRVVAIAQSPQTTATTSSTTKKTSTSSSMASKEVTRSGVVTALPGTFGSQIAFIEGLQLYFYYADWPMLELGDVVTVTGEISESQGEDRLKLSETGDMQITGHIDLKPTAVTIDRIASIVDGSLVTIHGTATNIQDAKMVLQDETGTVIVVANARENMQWNAMTSELEITGIVRTVSGETRIYPRNMQDVIQIQEDVQEGTSEPVVSATSRSNDATPWIGGGLILATLAGLGYFFVRRSPLKTAPVGA